MNELIKADSICAYNEWAGVITQNPLVGFIDFSTVKPLRHARKLYGLYAIFLKDVKCGELRYGRQYYDYQDGTLIFVAPGQVFGADDDGEMFQPTGYLLLFHPDLLRDTPLGRLMKEYTFFSYFCAKFPRIMKNEPIYNLLNTINYPDDLRRLDVEQLPEVCSELRQDIIKELSCNPGHFRTGQHESKP